MQTRRITLLLLLAATLAFAANRKVAPDLERVAPDRQVDVIVHYTHPPQAHHHAKMASRGARLRRNLELVNSAAYSIPASSLAELENDPNVEYVSPDRPVAATLDYANPAINAGIARQYGWDGAGVTVAVIDSGIMDTHPDLQNSNGSRVVYAESFNLTEGNDPYDRYGHGTHVAAILGGDATASTGASYTRSFWGTAPKVRFVSLKVLDRSGRGTDSMVIAAIQRAIALKNTYNIRVINLSLGRPVVESYQVDPLCQAVEQAWKAGIVVVVAAGNDGRNNTKSTAGYGTINSPGNDPYVITVGAMKDMKSVARGDDQMASYSSKGPSLYDHVAKPDLVAPGNKIIASIPTGLALTNSYPGNKVLNSYYIAGGAAQGSDYYFELSGTSMATPMVAGAAALLLQKQPNLTPDQIKARLMKTAAKNFPLSSVSTDPVTGAVYTVYYDMFTVGAGYLDVWAALNNNDTISATKRALSPSVTYNSVSKKVVLATDDNIVWGDAGLALNIVWGDQVLLSNSIVHATDDNIVWGDSTMTGFTIVWATDDNIVWGDGVPQGEVIPIAINGER